MYLVARPLVAPLRCAAPARLLPAPRSVRCASLPSQSRQRRAAAARAAAAAAAPRRCAALAPGLAVASAARAPKAAAPRVTADLAKRLQAEEPTVPADVAVRPQWAAHYCAAGAGSAPWQTGGFKDADARERDDSGGEVHPPRAFAGGQQGGHARATSAGSCDAACLPDAAAAPYLVATVCGLGVSRSRRPARVWKVGKLSTRRVYLVRVSDVTVSR